jgi:N-acetylglucosamine kinase-like BadF-type ATPase
LRHFIGIDGGGTKTMCVMVDEEGTVVAASRGPGSNVNSRPWDEAMATVAGLIDDVLVQSGADRWRIAGLFAGLAGSDRAGEKERWIGYLHDRFPEWRGNVMIHNDAVAALAAGTWGEAGIVLIAGTGSIACGYDPDRDLYVRAGGWGYLLGDEGSGFDLGRRGLMAILRRHDGRGPETMLADLVLGDLGLASPEQLIPHYYGQADVRKAMSEAARYVLEAARAGDRAARDIVKQSVEELAGLAETVRTGMKVEKGMPLILGGGLFSDEMYRRAFLETPAIMNGGYRIQPLQLPPAVGSCLLAMKHAGMTVTERMKNRIGETWRDKEAETNG